MRRHVLFPLALTIALCKATHAHDWHSDRDHLRLHGIEHATNDDRQPTGRWVRGRIEPFGVGANHLQTGLAATPTTVTTKPAIAKHFEKFSNVRVRWNARQLLIESNELPEHPMMVGIRAWQQQVPLPQPFTGNNAWKIPLSPVLASRPISVRRNPLRGAIAVAVNGGPIFCALNNRGEDSYKLGELDRWGGHCGRGDDYHYHTAPVHLEKTVGRGNPIAFALDGFPIYGYTEADGSSPGALDEYNGQFDSNGNYHYHATRTFPYVNGGLRGQVTVRGDAIEGQPRDSPIRPALRPLRGATITDLQTTGSRSVLTYRMQGGTGSVTWVPDGSSAWKFTYRDVSGRTSTETYQRSQRTDNRGVGGPPPPPRAVRT